MASVPDGHATDAAVLIFENDPRQAITYRELFTDAGYAAQTALPSEDVQQLGQTLRPAYVYGILNSALGFERPVILALCTLPHQVRRAKRFGADSIWIRGVDDAAALPQLIADLLEQRREGKLKPKTPATPL